MRKAPIEDFGRSNGLSASGSWLDLEELATAELSSEDPRHPFEEALKNGRRDRVEGFGSRTPVDPATL